MQFEKTPIDGVQVVHLDRRTDERGFFARVFCENEFGAANMPMRIAQINNSLSARAGTLRGLHYQLPPSAETKVIRCLRGAIFDVALDIRPGSPSFGEWFGARLDEENRDMLTVPRGCAHAILTLEPNTEILYLVDNFYDPASERGIRWNDPTIDIAWPIEPVEVSEKDSSWPELDPEWHQAGMP